MIYRVDQDSSGVLCPYGYAWADNIYTYLNRYVSGLTHEMGTTLIDFNGLFQWKILTDRYPKISVVLNDGTELYLGQCGDCATNRTFRFTLISSDNFLFFTANRDYGGCVTLIWCKDTSGNYYAGGKYNDHNWDAGNEIYSNVYLYSINEPVSPFSFKKIFNFTAPPGKIVLARFQPVATSGNQLFATEDLYVCSTVPYRSTISIMGDTFLAVDTNTLIKMDMSED